jgi:hypothetical protein
MPRLRERSATQTHHEYEIFLLGRRYNLERLARRPSQGGMATFIARDETELDPDEGRKQN